MKFYITLLALGLTFISYGQDTTKTKGTVAVQTRVPSASTLPNARFARPSRGDKPVDLTGTYVVDRFDVLVRTKETKEAKEVLATEVIVADTIMTGPIMDSINYKIGESQFMGIEDYLYRIFGEVPEEVPADLPPNIMVHKTDNLECYAVAELVTGEILIPYKGLLLYLKLEN